MRVTGDWEGADEAIEGAMRNAPDLLITDIRLLGIDGLELSSRMRKINPGVRIIMVTGYEEFQYAKTALDIGVDAFLVKPVIFEELHAILERICREEQSKRLRSREELQMKEQIEVYKPIAQEQLLQEILHGLIVGEEAIRKRAMAFELFIAEGHRRVLTINDPSGRVEVIAVEDEVSRNRNLLKEAAEAAFGSNLELMTTSQRGNLILILRNNTELDKFEQETTRSIERLCAEMERWDSCNSRIGIGPPVAEVNQLSESFRLAQRAANLQLFGGEERVYCWKQLLEQGAGRVKSLEELTADLIEMLGAGDIQNSLSLLGELLSTITGNLQMHGAELRSFCMHLTSRAYQVASDIGEANRQFGSEQKLWEQLLLCREERELLQETIRIIKEISEFIADRRMSHAQIVVQKAIEYMCAHYKENLSLRSVAESVFLSPNYLGALFRTELGESFTDQLIRIRIQRAKDMLKNPEFKLYEVADQIGYQNMGYFTGLFKRMTGLSPKEYRDLHGYSRIVREQN